MSVNKYEKISDSNVAVGDGFSTVGIQEGMPRRDVNNAMRSMCSDIAKYADDNTYLLTGGSADVLTVTTASEYVGYSEKMTLWVKFHVSPNSGSSINVNNLGEKPLLGVVNGTAAAISSGQVGLNHIHKITYDGAGFVVSAIFDSAQSSLQFARSASGAGQLVAQGNGRAGMLDGTSYIVDTTIALADSATADLSVDSLVPLGVVKPQHFGAIADGVADDAAALNRIPTSGYVFIPRGVYNSLSEIVVNMTGDMIVEFEEGAKLILGAKADSSITFNMQNNPYNLTVKNPEIDVNNFAPYGILITNHSSTMNNAGCAYVISPKIRRCVAQTGEFGCGVQFYGGFNEAIVEKPDISGVHFAAGSTPTAGVHSVRAIAFSSSGVSPAISSNNTAYPKRMLVHGGSVSNVYALDADNGRDQDAIAYIGPQQLGANLVVDGVSISTFNTRGVKSKAQNTLVKNCHFSVSDSDLGATRAANTARHFIDLQGAGGTVIDNVFSNVNCYAQDAVQIVWNGADGQPFEFSRNIIQQNASSTSHRIVFPVRYIPFAGFIIGSAKMCGNIVRESGASHISEFASLRSNSGTPPFAELSGNIVDGLSFDFVSVISAAAPSGVVGKMRVLLKGNQSRVGSEKLIFDNESIIASGQGNIGFTSDSNVADGDAQVLPCVNGATVEFDPLSIAEGLRTTATFALTGLYGAQCFGIFSADRYGNASSLTEVQSGTLVHFGGIVESSVSGVLNVWLDNTTKKLNVKNLLPGSWAERVNVTVLSKS